MDQLDVSVEATARAQLGEHEPEDGVDVGAGGRVVGGLSGRVAQDTDEDRLGHDDVRPS